MRSLRLHSFFFPVALVVSACGGTPSPGPAAPASAPAPASAAPAGAAPGAAAGPATGGEPLDKSMKGLAPTAMAADLKALGVDLAALPELDQLPPDTLRKVMKTFTKALGARCDDCHVAGNFATPTPRKAVTMGMWNHFVRELSAKDGSPVYCDSCHQGTITPLLDRHDDKALGKGMQDNYVAPLARRDGKSHDCATCHGEPFNGRFVKGWASAPAPK
jgi:hypothetical protein